VIAAAEDDAADDDKYKSAAFMITDTTYTTRDRNSSMVLSSPAEVLLDNQAGRSIFKNRSLLSNVGKFTPFYIAGFNCEIGKSHRGSKSVENLENTPSTK
jgi:hypothetical protein